MPILAIGLAPDISSSFSIHLGVELCCVNGIEQALDLLAIADFRLVFEDTRQRPEADRDLARLLAATTPGTPIFALANPSTLPDSHYWQSQGITLLYQPLRIDDISRMMTINR